MAHTEQSFLDLEQETYKRQLLHQYKTKSPYAELWLRLKYTSRIEEKLKPAIAYSSYNATRKALGRLCTSDSYFAEFCRLHYGQAAILHTAYNEQARMIVAWLDYGNQINME